MADYCPVLARAVSSLADNTPEARHALYDRARAALFSELHQHEPPLTDAEITRERNSLEVAIQDVEWRDATQRTYHSRPAPSPYKPTTEAQLIKPANAQIYFNEQVNGYKLLITSNTVSFRGRQLPTTEVDTASAIRRSLWVNFIPTSSTYVIELGSKGHLISIQFGCLFRLGEAQYERLRTAVYNAVVIQLLSNALQRLAAGETVVFERPRRSAFAPGWGLLENDSRFAFSRAGLAIEQTGFLVRKNFTIRWRNLEVKKGNGRYRFNCCSTHKTAAVDVWNMSNNMVFLSLLSVLMDKAVYRSIEEKSDKT
jgi:hypothetical protein